MKIKEIIHTGAEIKENNKNNNKDEPKAGTLERLR